MAVLKRRPTLLFLCQTLPYPPDGGVWIRTYHVMCLLAHAFDITALCFERAGSAGATSTKQVTRCPEALQQLGEVEVFPLPHNGSRLRFAWDHARSLLSGRVYTTFVYDSEAFRVRLGELLRSRRFELVHADSLDLARYLRACDGLPVVVVHHDIESDLLSRRAAVAHSPWVRSYLRRQSRLMQHVEQYWCPRVALNVVMSDHDGERIQGAAPGSRVAVVPNGVDLDEFHPERDAGRGIAYVGGTNPFPNLDALEFFCEQILPRIRDVLPETTVWWIGRASRDQQARFRERHRVELTGYVPDVTVLMRQARCHIVPLRIGGGTRLKILNAWAMAKPVVSTPIGCEGLAAIDGENVLIREHPQAFADAVIQVLTDEGMRRQLGERGRAAAEQLYSWDVIGRGMIESYLDVLSTQRRGASILLAKS
jgi:glycosyltransferase involved in cell wall biosynthesis